MCRLWSLSTIAALLSISGPAWADPDDAFDGPPAIRPDGAVPDIIWREVEPRPDSEGSSPATRAVGAIKRPPRPAPRLDEGPGTTPADSSGHGNDGTLQGGLT